MPVVVNAGKFDENLYLVDTYQFGVPHIVSAFLYWDGETCLIFDIGTSDNVTNMFAFLRKMKIPYKKVLGIIPSHYHFDHFGGGTIFWKKMVRKNPNFKIITTELTHDFLQHPDEHVIGARTTFGEFVGRMEPAPEDAYLLIEPDKNVDIIPNPEYTLALVSTPGHTPDSVTICIKKGDRCIFAFSGEAAGSNFNMNRIVSTVTCMPPHYKHDVYIKSLEKIRRLNAENLGVCHFGVITGNRDVEFYLKDHLQNIIDFRETVKKLYSENPSTRYIVENTVQKFWVERIDPFYVKNKLAFKMFGNIYLALVYGMLIDLGYRTPKYEKRKV